MTKNETRHAQSCRDALEHILNYLATEDVSELQKAHSAALDAKALGATRAEIALAKRLAGWSEVFESRVTNNL